jgi:hypothetical protein
MVEPLVASSPQAVSIRLRFLRPRRSPIHSSRNSLAASTPE